MFWLRMVQVICISHFCSLVPNKRGHGGLRCGGVANFLCGVAVISNPAVCDVCVFKSTVCGETKLLAVLRFLI